MKESILDNVPLSINRSSRSKICFYCERERRIVRGRNAKFHRLHTHASVLRHRLLQADGWFLRDGVLPNEKRKRASPCGERWRMSERRQMNVLIIFLDNKPAMPPSFGIFAIIVLFRPNVSYGPSATCMYIYIYMYVHKPRD